MRGNGSSESLQHNFWCDVCTWSQCPHTRLDILQPRKQTKNILLFMTWLHPMSKSWTKLLEERAKILLEHPRQELTLCAQTLYLKYFSSIDDMKIHGVCPEFRDKLFSVVMNVIYFQHSTTYKTCSIITCILLLLYVHIHIYACSWSADKDVMKLKISFHKTYGISSQLQHSIESWQQLISLLGLLDQKMQLG